MSRTKKRLTEVEWKDRVEKAAKPVSEVFKRLAETVPEDLIMKITPVVNGPVLPAGLGISKINGDPIGDLRDKKVKELRSLKGSIKAWCSDLVERVGDLRDLGDELETCAGRLDRNLGPTLSGIGAQPELRYEQEFEAMRETFWKEGKFFVGLLEELRDVLLDVNMSLDRLSEGLGKVERSHRGEHEYIAELKEILERVSRMKSHLVPYGRKHPIEQWQSKLTGMPEQEEWVQRDPYGREKRFMKKR